MGRDRTARNRIQQYLGEHGPVTDADGLATKLLKNAIGYEGSSVAFIQLIAVMEREGELERDVRGKRTYRIALAERLLATVLRRAPGGAAGTSEAVTAASAPGDPAIDYTLLARALLREMRTEMSAENSRLAQERDDYARRLELARTRLAELRGSTVESVRTGTVER